MAVWAGGQGSARPGAGSPGWVPRAPRAVGFVVGRSRDARRPIFASNYFCQILRSPSFLRVSRRASPNVSRAMRSPRAPFVFVCVRVPISRL